MTTNIPKSRTLGDLLDELAKSYRDNEAVIWKDSRLTYSQLKEEVDIFARSLLSLGIKRGENVALIASNRPEWLIAMFAIAKIGATTVAISTFSTQRELHWTLKHSRSSCVISISSLKNHNFIENLQEICPEYKQSKVGKLRSKALPRLKNIIAIEEKSIGAIINWHDLRKMAQMTKPENLQNAQDKVKSGDTCFILYTSGSTAEPKGVILAHGNVITNGYHIGERQALSDRDRLWFAVPLFWSFGSANALPAVITHGGCLVLQETFEPNEALEIMAAERCTVFYGMINIARALLEAPSYSLDKVKYMRTGLTIGLPEDIEFIIRTLDAKEICNVYGSTETYGNAAVCHTTDPLEVRLNSQGLPLPGMKIRAVDIETRTPLKKGVVGELTVAGCVTPGYFGNPKQTQSSFDKEGYFLTGDLGFVGEDGRIYYRGRLKEMIKTGGINVAPLEIENILMRYPKTKQAFVFGIPDAVKDEKIIAVLEIKDNFELDANALKKYCRRELASYKVPEQFILRTNEQLPRTSTGKINKPELKSQIIEEMKSHASNG